MSEVTHLGGLLNIKCIVLCYIYVCLTPAHTHTHTHIYNTKQYILCDSYIYIFMTHPIILLLFMLINNLSIDVIIFVS